MRRYLVAYFAAGAKGRTFIDTPHEPPVTRAQIEDWERLIGEQNGLSQVGIYNFVEIASPSLEQPTNGADKAGVSE